MRKGGAIAGCHGLLGYDKDARSFMGLRGVFWTVREWQGQGGREVVAVSKNLLGTGGCEGVIFTNCSGLLGSCRGEGERYIRPKGL